MAPSGDPLLGTDYEVGEPGCCKDCRKWIQWRSLSSNRNVWRSAATVALLLEMALYAKILGDRSFTLQFMGAVFVLKNLVCIWGQPRPTWLAPNNCCMFVVMFALIMPSVLMTYAYCTCGVDLSFRPVQDTICIVLYLFGSALSLVYELQRFYWKAKPENQGKLHTVGLAAYCIHPNYFGDLFTCGAWAGAAHTTFALATPITMLWSFPVVVIPNSDKYLASRYPEFPEYAAKTATLVPGFHSKWLEAIIAWVSFFVASYIWAALWQPCMC